MLIQKDIGIPFFSCTNLYKELSPNNGTSFTHVSFMHLSVHNTSRKRNKKSEPNNNSRWLTVVETLISSQKAKIVSPSKTYTHKKKGIDKHTNSQSSFDFWHGKAYKFSIFF